MLTKIIYPWFKVILFILFSLITIYGQNSNKYICGKAVDERQFPVRDARVFFVGDDINAKNTSKFQYEPLATDGLTVIAKSNDTGNFCIETAGFIQTGKLIVTNTIKEPSSSVMSDPKTWVDMPGLAVALDAQNQITKVGSIKIQTYYTELILNLKPEKCSRDYIENIEPEYRIKKANGDIVSGPGQLASNIGNCSLSLILPEGNWIIELSIDGGRNWLSSNILRVAYSSRPKMVSLSNLSETKCSSKVFASRQLRELGFELNTYSFLDRAKLGNLQALRLFLCSGINPDTQDKYGNTALIFGAPYLEIVSELIKHKTNVNQQNKFGMTALAAAVTGNNLEVAKLLLSNEANPNLSYKDGKTPLMYAAMNGNEDIINLLLNNNAIVSTKDNEGKTALDYALEYEHTSSSKLLMERYSKLMNK